MISISKLLCDVAEPGDALRYVADQDTPRPIIVWNCTRQCNLRCLHCYSSNGSQSSAETINTNEGKRLIGDLAAFGIPVLLFSGGEPLLRGDVLELASFARGQGIRPVLSTNGTLITKGLAKEVAKHNINVNCISPGTVATPRVLTYSKEILQKIVDATYAGRLAEPEEMANVVLFLASDEASYIMGENLVADGGELLGPE